MSAMNTESVNSSDDNDEDDGNWQQVATKRKNTGSPNIFRQKRPHHDDGPSTSNRYATLATNDVADNDINEPSTTIPKPPPIFIPNVADIGKMVNSVNKVIPSSDFHYKSLRDGQVRLVINNIDSYRSLIKHFDTAKINYHTFQLKQERAFRVVIKGLHHTTPISDIKAMLLSLGHQVRSVRNVISQVKNQKQPLPMFFVDLDPKENNKDVYDIRYFDNAKITIEAPKKFDDIVQCYRCQDYGHTKSYCRKSFRCVKCGLGHATAECTKSAEVPPKCVHCSNNHTANYRGCTVYQKLIQTRSNRTNTNQDAQHLNHHNYTQPTNIQYSNIPHVPDTNPWTYSQAVRGEPPGISNVLDKIEAMLAKQIELTNTLMNMMSMLMTKLCK